MATEYKKILIRRGATTPPTDLSEGELAYRTDTDILYVGTGDTTDTAGGSHYEQVGTRVTVGGNKVDTLALTATAAELNILDGVTATAAELNILDGVTATAAELNILDGVTSTAAELNILDGVTSTAAELNLLDGVTASTAELNLLDGVTASTTELNYVDGVTSGIQGQLDALSTGKANLAGPTFTGTPTAPTASDNTNSTQLATTAFVANAINDAGGFSAANVEWNFVEKVSFTSGTSFTINNNALISNPFSTSGGDDFKFVVEITTTAEDTASPTIQLNGETTAKYNYIVTDSAATDLTHNAATANPVARVAYEQTSIPFSVSISDLSDNVSLTHFHSEFVVSHQTFRNIPGFQDDATNLIINGTAMMTAMEDSSSHTHKVWPQRSDFSGNIFIGDTYFNSLTITHNLDAGANDNAVVRIYKRAR